MKVLFVWFNFDCPVGFSHGLAVLSHELKEEGHQVDLLHINEAMGTPWDLEKIVHKIVGHHPDVVGMSFGSNHAWAAKELAAATKKALPSAVIICGGIHCTILPEEVVSWSGVDLVFAGEADDYRLAAALESIRKGTLPTRMPGVWTRSRKGPVGNPLPPPVDLSARRRPADLSLFDHNRIIELKRGYADVISGRGCPYGCSYCHNRLLRNRYRKDLGLRTVSELRYVRKRTVEDVISELEEYRVRYGERIKVFSFTDDLFITDKKWFYDFLEAYRKSFNLPLVFCSTIHQIDEDTARRSAAAGVYMVRIGVESGSPRVRREILNRTGSNSEILRAVRTLQRAGVNVLTFNMLAIPGENASDVNRTFRFASSLGADAVQFSVFWPYPRTELFHYCQQKGLLRHPLIMRGNYLSESPLLWPAARRRFYDRIRFFYAAALNRFLPEPVGGRFGSILRRMKSIPEEEWKTGGRLSLIEEARNLEVRFKEHGHKLYLTPFPERPDILLLYHPQRQRPLINL